MSKESKGFNVPISTISGGKLSIVRQVFSEHRVDDEYLAKKRWAYLISATGSGLAAMERLLYDDRLRRKEMSHPSVFVLGHWRSGTTYLHNLISQDPQMGYVTTYQSIFPNVLFTGKWLFKRFMQATMPKKRANDNVELNADYPQEEEFAIGNMVPLCFYYFWFFPRETRELYHRYVEYEGMTTDERELWKSAYKLLLNKALINTRGQRIVSKNPPHTGRIKLLLETFPNAKFIHIYRNPITVFRSTRKLHITTMPPLQFQNITEQEMEENILYVYEKMMKRYFAEKDLIPKDNLVEVQFEKFEQSPFEQLREIYRRLQLPGFDEAAPHLQKYIASQKSYTKNRYSISRAEVDRVVKHWGFAMERWGYEVPDNMQVV